MKNFESNLPCVCCGKNGKGQVTFHHLKTRKSYSDFVYKEWNLLPLCQYHHNEAHQKGLNYMASNYTGVKRFLILNEWEFDNYSNKWLIPFKERVS